MAIAVKKKDNESNESVIRRFTRKVQSTGLLIQKKRIQYREKRPNKRQQRQSAIRRRRMQQERDFLIKTGKLTEEQAFTRSGKQLTKTKVKK